MSEWISVAGRLPELPKVNCVFEQVECIVTNGRQVGTCHFQWGNGAGKVEWRSWSSYGDIAPEEITHWQPMPEPPEVSS